MPEGGWVTATWARQCPADACRVARVGVEPTNRSPRFELGRFTGLRTAPQASPAGVEPALPPWQGSRLPLHHGRIESPVELSKIESTGRDSNPRRRRPTFGRCPGCGILAADHRFAAVPGPVPVVQVGSEGLEPSPTWLRARHAATSTLIPCVSASCQFGAEGIEPSAWSL